MWRSRSSEEWERKKSFLLRSLFEDIPILSPILEEHEPASSPSNFINRCESPLPELIIEVEPKKANLHDDPEELYDQLAKDMWRMYRKDFLGIGSSSANSSSETLYLGRIHDNIISDESNDENTDGKGRSSSEYFAKDTSASDIDSSSSRNVNSLDASPEIMRQRQTIDSSFETPPRRPNSESNSTISKAISLSMEVDSKEFSDDVLASKQEIEIAESSGNETLLFLTSTPSRKRSSSRFSRKTGHKRRLVSYSSSPSFGIAANAATQTSFSDCETDWSFFWSNFFKGIPKVYNVCSCNDHVCTT